jgi:hypothetical protein
VTPRPTLGQILRPFLADPAAADLRLSPHQWKTLRALAKCRTSALGGQAFYCPACRREHVVAHSCRNRHCPHCQGARGGGLAGATGANAPAGALFPPGLHPAAFPQRPDPPEPAPRSSSGSSTRQARRCWSSGAQRLDARLGITRGVAHLEPDAGRPLSPALHRHRRAAWRTTVAAGSARPRIICLRCAP